MAGVAPPVWPLEYLRVPAHARGRDRRAPHALAGLAWGFFSQPRQRGDGVAVVLRRGPAGRSRIIARVAWWPWVGWSEPGMTDAARSTPSSAPLVAPVARLIGQLGSGVGRLRNP